MLRRPSACRRLAGLAPRRALCEGKTTHFGYRTVPQDEKERLVRHVFENVASKYDIMNDLMSGGVHRVWKDTMVDMLGGSAIAQSNLQVLDVAGGTGDIAFRISRALSKRASGLKPASSSKEPAEESRIVISDINEAMLDEGRRRAATLPELSAAGSPRLEWVVADARQLPFDDCSFDVYTIAFGIRNVTVIPEALAEARRVLRPGGRFLCLEFSQVGKSITAQRRQLSCTHCIASPTPAACNLATESKCSLPGPADQSSTCHRL